MSQATPEAGPPQPAGPRYQPLVIVLAAVCAGIAGDRFLRVPLFGWCSAAGVAWIAWLLLWRRGRDRAAAAALLLAATAAAAAWHHCRWYLFAADDLGYFARTADQPVCLEAIALKMPRPAPPPSANPMRVFQCTEITRVEIAPVSIRDGDRWRAASGRTKLTVLANLPDVQPGDRLRIFAQLVSPPAAQNPGEFDYAQHLRGQRTLCAVVACVDSTPPPRSGIGDFSRI